MNPGGPQYRNATNEAFTSNPLFRSACELAGVPPTKRQASKWRNRKGQAYAKRHEATKAMQEGAK